MNKHYVDRVLENFDLTPKQKLAAVERGRDVAVTAGAGSGKTRTLVARYASLLAEGYEVRKVVAITFSEKAAREMRSRARETLEQLVRQATSEEERGFWLNLNNQMDAARISTIHSLCAEVLRAHPVEARVDPRFDVLDEGLTAALRAQVVSDTMTRLVGKPEFAPLFKIMGTRDLSNLLALLMEKRLEAQEIFDHGDPGGKQIVHQVIQKALSDASISDCIAELRSMGITAIYHDAGDILGQQVDELLARWNKIELALSTGDIVSCVGFLYQARRKNMGLGRGSNNLAGVQHINDLQNSL